MNSAPSVTITTPDSTVVSETVVSLQATVSDTDHSDGDLGILWSASQGTFSDAGVVEPSWTAPAVTEETTVVLTLTVGDGVAADVARTVTMTVIPPLMLADFSQDSPAI